MASLGLFEIADRTRTLHPGGSAGALARAGLPAVTASSLAARSPLIGSTRAMPSTRAVPLLSRVEHPQPLGWLTPASTGGAGGGNPGRMPPASLLLPAMPAAQVAQSVQVVGQPSRQLYLERGSGDTVTALRRYTGYMEYLGAGALAELRRLIENAARLAESMSQGPLTQRDLRRLGGPYGFDSNGGGFVARKVPRGSNGKSLGHVRGVRGSVPTLAVTNIQTGMLARSWRPNLQVTADGIVLELRNIAKTAAGAPYPWFLAAGTERQGRPLMQAHGPFTYALVLLLDQINAAWTRATVQAYHRSQAEALLAGRYIAV